MPEYAVRITWLQDSDPVTVDETALTDQVISWRIFRRLSQILRALASAEEGGRHDL